ncbi:MAG: hypothetical protein ACKOAT_03555, partial [Actinomycetota bacterium]
MPRVRSPRTTVVLPTQRSYPVQNYGVGMAGGTPNNFGLGRVGVWTFALDLQPMHKSQEAAQELEELGYGCIW